MDFTVALERNNSIVYQFEDDQFEPFDTNEEASTIICGKIRVDGNKIGLIKPSAMKRCLAT